MSEQHICTIETLNKVINRKEILKNINLSFYPGAKIGVIGGNGAGKSTLLRIMAQVDKDFVGTCRSPAGTRIAFVPQEPRLDESTDVKGNLELAVAAIRALLNREQEIVELVHIVVRLVVPFQCEIDVPLDPLAATTIRRREPRQTKRHVHPRDLDLDGFRELYFSGRERLELEVFLDAELTELHGLIINKILLVIYCASKNLKLLRLPQPLFVYHPGESMCSPGTDPSAQPGSQARTSL